MKRDVSFWCRNCVQCQRARVTRHNYEPVQKYPPPSQKFRQLNVDIAGPLPNSNDYTYILVLVDTLSRWPVAVPMKDSRTQTLINALMHNWISLYGVPETITGDRGSQFFSQEWKDLLKFLGIRHIHTTAYHSRQCSCSEQTCFFCNDLAIRAQKIELIEMNCVLVLTTRTDNNLLKLT